MCSSPWHTLCLPLKWSSFSGQTEGSGSQGHGAMGGQAAGKPGGGPVWRQHGLTLSLTWRYCALLVCLLLLCFLQGCFLDVMGPQAPLALSLPPSRSSSTAVSSPWVSTVSSGSVPHIACSVARSASLQDCQVEYFTCFLHGRTQAQHNWLWPGGLHPIPKGT